MNFEEADAFNEAIRAIGIRHRALAIAALAPFGIHPGHKLLLLELEAAGPSTQAQLATASGPDLHAALGDLLSDVDRGVLTGEFADYLAACTRAGAGSSTAGSGRCRSRTATAAVANKIPHEMLLLDLYSALRPLDAITGATTTDDILNLIFRTFCIGK